MPTTGGIFALLTSSWYPAVADTDIDPDDSNATLADIAQGLTDRLMADGSKQITGNLDYGGHKATALGAATTAGDAVRYEQVIGSVFQPYSAKLLAIDALTWADDRMLDLTGTGTIAVVTYATVLANIGAVTTARLVSAGTGLTGGGDLSADRTLTLDLGAKTWAGDQIIPTAAPTSQLSTGYRCLGDQAEKTAGYTFVAADAGKAVDHNSASAHDFTLNISVFQKRDFVTGYNAGAGTLTIKRGASIVLRNAAGTDGDLTVLQYQQYSIRQTDTTNTWVGRVF